MKAQKITKNKIKIFLKILIWPILLWIGQFIIVWLLSLYYVTKENINIGFSKTSIFQQQFQIFVNEHQWVIFLFQLLILFPFFFWKYKKRKIEKDTAEVKKTFFYFLIGGSCGILLNIFLNKIFKNSYEQVPNFLLFYQVLMIGIIGPILEEIVYRGIMKYELEKSFSNISVMFIISIIFAFSHQGVSNICYAFFMGFLFYYLLYKGSIKYAMAGHIGANVITLIVGNYTLGWTTHIRILFFANFLFLAISVYKIMIFDK